MKRTSFNNFYHASCPAPPGGTDRGIFARRGCARGRNGIKWPHRFRRHKGVLRYAYDPPARVHGDPRRGPAGAVAVPDADLAGPLGRGHRPDAVHPVGYLRAVPYHEAGRGDIQDHLAAADPHLPPAGDAAVPDIRQQAHHPAPAEKAGRSRRPAPRGGRGPGGIRGPARRRQTGGPDLPRRAGHDRLRPPPQPERGVLPPGRRHVPGDAPGDGEGGEVHLRGVLPWWTSWPARPPRAWTCG